MYHAVSQVSFKHDKVEKKVEKKLLYMMLKYVEGF